MDSRKRQRSIEVDDKDNPRTKVRKEPIGVQVLLADKRRIGNTATDDVVQEQNEEEEPDVNFDDYGARIWDLIHDIHTKMRSSRLFTVAHEVINEINMKTVYMQKVAANKSASLKTKVSALSNLRHIVQAICDGNDAWGSEIRKHFQRDSTLEDAFLEIVNRMTSEERRMARTMCDEDEGGTYLESFQEIGEFAQGYCMLPKFNTFIRELCSDNCDDSNQTDEGSNEGDDDGSEEEDDENKEEEDEETEDIDFQTYADQVADLVFERYAGTRSSEQFEAAGGVCYSIANKISQIKRLSGTETATLGTKFSALDALIIIATTISESEDTLGREIRQYFSCEEELENTVEVLLRDMTDIERGMLCNNVYEDQTETFLEAFDATMRTAKGYCLFTRFEYLVNTLRAGDFR